MRYRSLYIFLSAIFILYSCSSEQNTWTSKTFHNTTAHYNGYFYAREEINRIEATIRANHVDDFNRILRLYPTFDSALTRTFDKEIQESIKMASIAIQRHPKSKWVDDAYILVGKARLYSLDWGNAIQTFKYTNKISKDRDTRHLAILNLIRTYIEHGEYNNARAAIDYLQKEKLSKTNKKRFLLEKAYFHQLHNDFDNMVRNLTEASRYLKKSDRRGRIYFIIGQVYQRLGFESEAYNYYRKCLSTNPEYEVDFYARLYMAQVTEISRSRDVNMARKSFHKLLKDLKNKEFKDKIYYEMGIFEFKQNNLKEAIENFKLSVKHGTNKRIDGEAFLRLGEIYYDSLKNYELSHAYYDSAITSLPADYENYGKIKTRQETLNEFVQHLRTIQWQDSLLNLSSLDSTVIRKMIGSLVTERKKADETRADKNKKRTRIEISANDNSSIFGTDDDAQPGGGSDNTGWYFSNPSTLGVGQAEFARVWGNIPLQDDWRRSLKESTSGISSIAEDNARATVNGQNAAKEETIDDIIAAEYEKLSAEIPRTQDAREEALAKIEDAYFRLAEIYYFKLQENKNAIDAYNQLLTRFPQSEHEPEVLYTLYLIMKDSDPATAEKYSDMLKTKHPGTSFAKILINPSYLRESSQAAEKQKQLYRIAYTDFENGSLRSADSILRIADSFGETIFTPSIELLKILIVGETEDISKYQYLLTEFQKKYPDTPGAAYAKTLLEKSRSFQELQEKRKGIRYIRSLEEPHYFVIVYRQAEKLDNIVSAELEQFNQSYFPDFKFNISTLIFNDQYSLTFVSDILNVTTAIEYYRTFNENLAGMKGFRNYKFDNFVITKDNFDIFYRTKGFDEYIQFFEKNYPKENP